MNEVFTPVVEPEIQELLTREQSTLDGMQIDNYLDRIIANNKTDFVLGNHSMDISLGVQKLRPFYLQTETLKINNLFIFKHLSTGKDVEAELVADATNYGVDVEKFFISILTDLNNKIQGVTADSTNAKISDDVCRFNRTKSYKKVIELCGKLEKYAFEIKWSGANNYSDDFLSVGDVGYYGSLMSSGDGGLATLGAAGVGLTVAADIAFAIPNAISAHKLKKNIKKHKKTVAKLASPQVVRGIYDDLSKILNDYQVSIIDAMCELEKVPCVYKDIMQDSARAVAELKKVNCKKNPADYKNLLLTAIENNPYDNDLIIALLSNCEVLGIAEQDAIDFAKTYNTPAYEAWFIEKCFGANGSILSSILPFSTQKEDTNKKRELAKTYGIINDDNTPSSILINELASKVLGLLKTMIIDKAKQIDVNLIENSEQESFKYTIPFKQRIKDYIEFRELFNKYGLLQNGYFYPIDVLMNDDTLADLYKVVYAVLVAYDADHKMDESVYNKLSDVYRDMLAKEDFFGKNKLEQNHRMMSSQYVTEFIQSINYRYGDSYPVINNVLNKIEKHKARLDKYAISSEYAEAQKLLEALKQTSITNIYYPGDSEFYELSEAHLMYEKYYYGFPSSDSYTKLINPIALIVKRDAKTGQIVALLWITGSSLFFKTMEQGSYNIFQYSKLVAIKRGLIFSKKLSFIVKDHEFDEPFQYVATDKLDAKQLCEVLHNVMNIKIKR